MGFFSKVKSGARWAGKTYVWLLVGDLKERKQDFARFKDRLHEVTHHHYREETFEDAIVRMNVTENDLQQKARYLSSVGFLYGLVTVVSMLFLIMTPLSQHPVNYALMTIGVGFIAISRFLAVRFRIAQLRARELFEFKDWFMGRKGWW